MDMTVKYCSTVRGCGDSLDRPPTHYYCGFVQRVPAAGPGHREAMIESVRKVQEYVGPTTLADGTEVEPVPGEALERFEVLDYETDEIIVLWRVPVRSISPSSV